MAEPNDFSKLPLDFSKLPLDFSKLTARGAQTARPSWATGRPSPRYRLGAGTPDPAAFPVDDLAAAAERALRLDQGRAALQYGGHYGYDGLRDILATRTGQADGRRLTIENVLLTTGAAQAISLACFTFVNPGDVVIVEGPTFATLVGALPAYGARTVTVSTDEHGMDIDELEMTLTDLQRRGERVKLIYTIATCHNPTGVHMAPDRRQRLVEAAARAQAIVLEDTTYADLCFTGPPPPSLFSLDPSTGSGQARAGAVVKIGTFSKTVAPGLRVGWAMGDADAINAMASMRHDLGISPLLARIVADYAGSGKWEPHIQELVRLYRGKCDAMLAALGEYCGPLVRWRRPEGGFFIWLELAKSIDPDKLQEAAAEEGVAYSQGGRYFADGRGRQHARLAFSDIPAADIEPGMAAFGRALQRARRSILRQ